MHSSVTCHQVPAGAQVHDLQQTRLNRYATLGFAVAGQASNVHRAGGSILSN